MLRFLFLTKRSILSACSDLVVVENSRYQSLAVESVPAWSMSRNNSMFNYKNTITKIFNVAKLIFRLLTFVLVVFFCFAQHVWKKAAGNWIEVISTVFALQHFPHFCSSSSGMQLHKHFSATVKWKEFASIPKGRT